MAVTEGKAAPAFSLDSTEGRKLALKDFKGKFVILYFYPKDDTPGCTTEACNFRDSFADITAKNAVILGVSPDALPAHDKFKSKYALPFPLLSDPGHVLAEEYGVWKEKENYGKTYMGIERTTFLIDPAGKIARVFPKVKVAEHHKEILAALVELAAER